MKISLVICTDLTRKFGKRPPLQGYSAIQQIVYYVILQNLTVQLNWRNTQRCGRVGNMVVSEVGLDSRGRDSRDVTVHGPSCACRRSVQLRRVDSPRHVVARVLNYLDRGQAGVDRRPRPGHGAPGRNDEYGRQFLDCLIEPGQRRPAVTRSARVVARRRPAGAEGSRQFQGRLLSAPSPQLPGHPIIDALSNTSISCRASLSV